MVTCKKCSSENSVDSLFCRKCGAEIADEARVEAQQKLQDLVAEGYRIFNEGRTEEARLIAEAGLEEDPRFTSALSLKGMCHERAGEVAEALAVYERVVELNPDSALDRIKVTHLRQTLAGRSLAEPPPSRSRALLGAIAAVVLVVAIGIAIGASMPQDEPAKDVAKLEPAGMKTDSFGNAPVSSTPQEPAKEPVKTQEPTPSDVGPIQNGASRPNVGPAAGNAPRIRLPDLRDSRIPMVNGEITDDGTKPVRPPEPSNLTVQPTGNSGRGVNSDSGPDPKIDTSSNGSASTAPKKPDFDPGLIDIRVSKPKTTLGGSQDLPDSNGVEALLKAARQQFLLGKHGQAAGSYEAALRAGADPASTNQRIGQAYANAGQNSQAAAAYRRAIASYEAQLNGPGDHSRVQAALEACRRALKTLGG